MTNLARQDRHRDEIASHVLEKGLEVYFLLIAGADCRARLLADNGHNRNVVHLRVVEPVKEMDRAWARSGIAKTNLARKLCMG